MRIGLGSFVSIEIILLAAAPAIAACPDDASLDRFHGRLDRQEADQSASGGGVG